MTWRSVQLRYVAHLAYGDSLAGSERVEGTVPVYGSNGQVGLHDKPNTSGPVIVVGRKGSYGKVQFSPIPVFAIDTTFSVDSSQTAADLRWLYYALNTLGLDSLSEDVGVPGLSRERAYRARLPVPPPAAQRAIAAYLDAETARIDALIEKKRRIADLLEEDLVSRLDEALSRAHRLSLRRLLLEPPQYGASESGVPHPELWPRYVRITDLEADGTLRSEDARYLQPAIASRYMLRNRDVLIARSGATVGKAFIYTDTMGPCCFAGYLIRFRFDERRMLPELAALWTRTADYWAQIRAGLVQATIENVSAERYKDLLVPVPSVEEQVALVRDAVRRRERSNGARLRLTRQVGLLEEHRQALITAAVTGEIDVPGVAA